MPKQSQPVYLQLALFIEDQIIDQTIQAHQRVYSKMQLAEAFTVNPITALKALNYLEEKGIVYGKRGLGMFVSEHALKNIMLRRKHELLHTQMKDMIEEAKKLGVQQIEMVDAIKEAWDKELNHDETIS